MSTDLILFDELPDVLEKFGQRFPDLIVRALQKAATKGRVDVVRSIQSTVPYPPIDTGAYMRSWVVSQYEDGADIQNDTIQGAVIEFGAKPHPPSREKIDALTQWALRKLRGRKKPKKKRRPGISRRKNGVKRELSELQKLDRSLARWANRQKAAKKFAWAVAKKHEKDGIQAKMPLRRAWPSIVRGAEDEIHRAISRDAKKNWGIR